MLTLRCTLPAFRPADANGPMTLAADFDTTPSSCPCSVTTSRWPHSWPNRLDVPLLPPRHRTRARRASAAATKRSNTARNPGSTRHSSCSSHCAANT